MITVIEPNGTIHRAATQAKLEELQRLVQGWIEPLAGPAMYDGETALYLGNEEALLRDLPVNPIATRMLRGFSALHPSGFRGNLIILTGKDREDFTS